MTWEWVGQASAFLQNRTAKLGGVGVVGDLCLDRFVFGSVDRISPEAPVPVLWAERSVEKPGCAANVAENLLALRSAFDFNVELLGVVGADVMGEKLAKLLERSTWSFKPRILHDPKRPTTVKTRYLAGSQHQMLRVDEESLRPLDSDMDANFFEESETLLASGLKSLVIQDYAKGLFTGDRLPRFIEMARARNIFTIVDPHRSSPVESYRGASLITPNVAEAETMLGRSLHKGTDDAEVAEACRELKKKLRLQMAVITRSAHGMTLVDDKDDIHHFPAIARAVFDVTGAGDTVAAMLGFAFAGGASAEVACTLATAAASVVVAKVGTATAQVDEILKELDFMESSYQYNA